ncbi:MAG: hypothetical protein IJ167_02460 [Lachnospiraceae bacterium]|nr:hypothetical protein [Lachnospiraceae bacterium]
MAQRKKRHKFLSRMKKRLLVVIVVALAAFVVLIYNLIKINLKDGAEY